MAEGVGRERTGIPERPMSRRGFLKLGGAGLAGVALLGAAGCGGSSGDDSGNLVFSMSPDSTGTLQKLVDTFNEEGKGFKVEYREMPADSNQYFDKLMAEFQGGVGGIDVIGADVVWPAQFAANDYILDLSSRFAEGERGRFLPRAIEANTYEGKIYGVPWFTNPGMLYYRKDLLEESGFSEPPGTWDELKEIARRVQQDAGVRYGFTFQGSNYEGGTVNGLEYIWTHGGEVIDGDRVVIDNPNAVAGLTMQRTMVEDGIAPKGVATFTETESQTIFLGGDAVFCRNWPFMYALVGDPKEAKIGPEQVGIAPLPAGEGGQSASALGGWNMLINAASQKQDQAWEFVRHMTSPEIQKQRAIESSLLPTRSVLYDDEEIAEKAPLIPLGKDALQSARPRPVSPFYSDMSLSMAEGFNDSLTGAATPEETVASLQEELTKISRQDT